MNKKTIQEFVKSYNEITDDSLKDKMIESILDRRYLTFTEKIAIGRIMTEKAAVTYANVKTLNETTLYFNYQMSIIKYYTSLEFGTDRKSFEDYDDLKSSGVMDAIVHNLSESHASELSEFTMIYNNEADAFKEREQGTRFLIAHLVEKFSNTINEGLKRLAGTVEKTDPDAVRSSIEVLKSEMAGLYKKAGK